MEILIIEDEVQIREMLAFYLQHNYEPISQIYLARNRQEAFTLLENQEIDICFCEHSLPDGIGLDVFNQIKKKHIMTHFVLIGDIDSANIENIYPTEEMLFYFLKPDILSSFEAFFKRCESNKIALKKKKYKTDYSPVNLEFLPLLGCLPCDVYIRLSENKFLKCFSKGDMFLELDKKKYSDKKIKTLFIKYDKESKQTISDAISAAIGKALAQKNTQLSERISVVHSQVIGMVRANGMTPEMSDLTRFTVVKSMDLISKHDNLADSWRRLNLLGEYPAKIFTLQSILSCLVLKELSWNSDGVYLKLGIAAFLQDITLSNLNLIKIKDYNEFLLMKDLFSAEEVKNYLDHPFLAKDLINSMREIPPDIDKIVFEQLELPTGKGYPRQMTALQLGQLSCIFNLTGYLAKEILEKDSQFNPKFSLEEMEVAGYSKGNFRPAFSILKKNLLQV